MIQDGFIITQGGQNLLAKCLLGKQLVFTRATFGDSELNGGKVIVDDDDDAFLLTDLISPKQDLPINGEPTISGGQVSIPFFVSNANINDGYWMRETGVFAADPDTQEEILYAYSNIGDKGGWMFPHGGSFVWEQTFIAILAVGNATNITAVVHLDGTPDLTGYVTQTEFQAHINNTTPHPNLVISGGDSTAPASTVDAEQIVQINSRLSQAETNIANLYMQQSTDNDLGAKPNLTLVEDFNGETVCDNFVQDVTVATAGASSITIAAVEGILPGSWYTLTDGLNSEFVQVVSIVKNGTTFTVNLASNIANTYTIANTKLYRSTTTVDDGQAYGAGNIRSELFNFTAVWRGRAAETRITTMELTLSQQSVFELEGDWAFTDDGYFTLA